MLPSAVLERNIIIENEELLLQKTKCSFCQSFLCICHLLTQEFILLYGPYATELEPTSSIGGSYHHLLFLRLCLSHKPISITIPNSEQCSEQHSVIQMCVFKWFYCTSWITHIAQLGKAYTFFVTGMVFHILRMQIHTERKFLNLLWSDIVQNTEMCLTVLTSICCNLACCYKGFTD